MLIDFCCSYIAGTHGRERAPSFTGTFVSHVSAENNVEKEKKVEYFDNIGNIKKSDFLSLSSTPIYLKKLAEAYFG